MVFIKFSDIISVWPHGLQSLITEINFVFHIPILVVTLNFFRVFVVVVNFSLKRRMNYDANEDTREVIH